MMKLVSIILPTYNEAENIQELIHEISRTVRYPKEIIVVDDNSPDGTSQKVDSYIKKTHRSDIRLETRKTNRGLTPSIKRGIELAKGDVVVWMDTDFSMPPHVINKLLGKIIEGYDIAVGSRFVAGGGTRRRGGSGESPMATILSTVFNRTLQFIFWSQFHDYTSGFIAVRREILQKIPLRGYYGEYFIDLMVRAFARKSRVVEVGYVCLPRRRGESKTGQHPLDYLWLGRRYMATAIRLVIEKSLGRL